MNEIGVAAATRELSLYESQLCACDFSFFQFWGSEKDLRKNSIDWNIVEKWILREGRGARAVRSGICHKRSQASTGKDWRAQGAFYETENNTAGRVYWSGRSGRIFPMK